MDWLPKQCSKHKWAPNTYQSNLALIQNLIIPYIGEMQIRSQVLLLSIKFAFSELDFASVLLRSPPCTAFSASYCLPIR